GGPDPRRAQRRQGQGRGGDAGKVARAYRRPADPARHETAFLSRTGRARENTLSSIYLVLSALRTKQRPLHHFVVPLPRFAGEEPGLRPAATEDATPVNGGGPTVAAGLDWESSPVLRGRGTAEGGGGGVCYV